METLSITYLKTPRAESDMLLSAIEW